MASWTFYSTVHDPVLSVHILRPIMNYFNQILFVRNFYFYDFGIPHAFTIYCHSRFLHSIFLLSRIKPPFRNLLQKYSHSKPLFYRNATWHVQHLVSCFISFEPVNVYIPRIVIGNIHQRNRPHNNVIHSGTLYSHMSPIQVIYINKHSTRQANSFHNNSLWSRYSHVKSALVLTLNIYKLVVWLAFLLLCTERVMSSL